MITCEDCNFEVYGWCVARHSVPHPMWSNPEECSWVDLNDDAAECDMFENKRDGGGIR